MDRRYVLLFALLATMPLSSAWILPHQVAYYSSPGGLVKACASVYFDRNTTVSLVCNGRVVGEANVLAHLPAVLCYSFSPTSSQTCEWTAGSQSQRISVYMDYSPVVDAVLAVLLIVLVVRFTVKLVRIMA